MLRVVNNFKNLAVTNVAVTNHFNFQIVRWRKPRWLPVAKSKMFKVPKRPVIPEEDALELQRLFNNYRTKMKSVRKYLIGRYSIKYLASSDPEEQKRIFEEDFKRCMEINDKWNEEQKSRRETYIAKELESELDFARKRMEAKLLEQEQKTELVENIVRKEKEESKHFISPKDLDAAIDHAIENPVDYNFALHLNGEKIIGRENNGVDVEKASIKQ